MHSTTRTRHALSVVAMAIAADSRGHEAGTPTALPPVEFDGTLLRGTKLPRYSELRRQMLKRFETGYVTAVLRAASGNISMASRIAQVDRKHLASHPSHWRTRDEVTMGA